jgi:DNA-binding CsgD family transcriptional regulator
MKPGQLRCAGVAPRSDRGRYILESIKNRHVNAPSRLAGYSSYLDCRRDGEDSDVKRDILDFPVPSQKRLKDLFDLTAAEARLAQLIACGDSVDEVAHKLCIKMTTARTQLAAIFAKTETRRQAKLVAILSRIAHLEARAQRERLLLVDAAQDADRHQPLHLV